MARDILVVPINVSTDLYIESIESPSVVSNNTRVFYARKATDTEYGVVKLTDITSVIGGSRVLNMTGAEILAAVSDDTIIVGSVAYCNLDGDIYEQSKLYKLNSDREWIEIDSKYVSEALDAHDIDVTAHENRFELKQDKTPNGVDNLININYKIDDAYLPPFIVDGGLVFGGTFGADGLIVASSKTPELNGVLIDNIIVASYPSVYFKATASYAFGGKSYDAGDIAICNGDITPNWTKIDGSDAVTGVKGNNEVAYRLGNVNITKDNIGLGEVDNTSDEDKPISTATKSYVDEELVKKANLDGATFTGDITIGSTETPKNLEVKGTTTVATPTEDLHAATKKYVDDAVVGNQIVTSWSDPLSDSKVPSEKLTKESLDLKADKVTSATNGNFAGLDANGNLTDSGKKASDFIGSDKLVTEFGETPLDTNVASEKLVYDELEKKVDYTDGNIDLDAGKTYKINDVDVISDKAKVDASNLTSGNVDSFQGVLGYERAELVYDKDNASAIYNWGYTNGLKRTNVVSGKNFSKYKRLRCFLAFFGEVLILNVDLNHYARENNWYSSSVTGVTYNKDAYDSATIMVNFAKTTITITNICYGLGSFTDDLLSYVFKIEGVY